MKYLFDLFRNARPREFVFFVGYSLYLVAGYMVFHSPRVFVEGGVAVFPAQTFFMIAVYVFRIILFAVGVCFFRFFVRLSVALVAAVTGALAIMGSLVAGMVFQFSPLLPSDLFLPWLLVAGALLGCGDALITLLWARLSSTLRLRSVYFYVLVCNAVSLVLYFAVTLFLHEFSLVVAVLLFLASTVFVQRAIRVRGERRWEYSRPVFQGAMRSMAQPMLGTVILSFMGGLMPQISGQQEIPLSDFQQTSLLTSAVVVSLLFLPTLIVKKPFNLGRLYAMALPLSAAGFLLLPIIWNAAGGIVNSFAQLGSMVAGIILWCLLADRTHDTKLPAVLLFGIAFACTGAATLAGTLVGFLNAETLKHGDLVFTTVAVVAAYLLLMAALFIFKDKGLKGIHEDDFVEGIRVAHAETFLTRRCADLAVVHQLTPRESEILVLLAQGFTVPVVSEKLFVSENTVKSHAKSIYRKLDIHVRSDLIELVNTG